MNLKTALGAIAAGILILLGIVLVFFGVIFAIASSVADTTARMNTAMLLLVGAFALFVFGAVIAYYVTRKPKTIIQRLEVSGEMKAVTLKCPNCSGSIDANAIKMVSGVPYATCPYCGHTFEVVEEPKW
jgi:Zn finger protein HypA/HybF involved in hydrogenase expression